MVWRPLARPDLVQQWTGLAETRADGADPADRAVAIVESARRAQLACPRCQSAAPQRNGHANGLQRFRCRVCRRTFNSLTGTPLARLRHKDKWLAFCASLLDPGTTVRRAAEQVGVHRNTSFRWRHRLLELTKRDRLLPLRGTVEVQALHLPESYKGGRRLKRPARKRSSPAVQGPGTDSVCVLVARDRHGRTHDAVAGRGPLTLAQLQRHLGPALHTDVLLMTNGTEPFTEFARATGVRHASAMPHTPARQDSHAHLEHVDGYVDRLCKWLCHFRGVATRYLENYCGWRWAIDGPRIDDPDALLRCAVGSFLSQR